METVSWPGRLERLKPGKLTREFLANTHIWIDGGHNPAAGQVIAQALRKQLIDGRKLLLVCGMINTKEPIGYFEAFRELGCEVYTVPVAMSDAGIEPAKLAEYASIAGLEATSCDNLPAGIRKAAAFSRDNPNALILLCGSIYMVGEVLKLNGTPPE